MARAGLPQRSSLDFANGKAASTISIGETHQVESRSLAADREVADDGHCHDSHDHDDQQALGQDTGDGCGNCG